jgi:hypothetical protein
MDSHWSEQQVALPSHHNDSHCPQRTPVIVKVTTQEAVAQICTPTRSLAETARHPCALDLSTGFEFVWHKVRKGKQKSAPIIGKDVLHVC